MNEVIEVFPDFCVDGNIFHGSKTQKELAGRKESEFSLRNRIRETKPGSRSFFCSFRVSRVETFCLFHPLEPVTNGCTTHWIERVSWKRAMDLIALSTLSTFFPSFILRYTSHHVMWILVSFVMFLVHRQLIHQKKRVATLHWFRRHNNTGSHLIPTRRRKGAQKRFFWWSVLPVKWFRVRSLFALGFVSYFQSERLGDRSDSPISHPPSSLLSSSYTSILLIRRQESSDRESKRRTGEREETGNGSYKRVQDMRRGKEGKRGEKRADRSGKSGRRCDLMSTFEGRWSTSNPRTLSPASADSCTEWMVSRKEYSSRKGTCNNQIRTTIASHRISHLFGYSNTRVLRIRCKDIGLLSLTWTALCVHQMPLPFPCIMSIPIHNAIRVNSSSFSPLILLQLRPSLSSHAWENEETSTPADDFLAKKRRGENKKRKYGSKEEEEDQYRHSFRIV